MQRMQRTQIKSNKFNTVQKKRGRDRVTLDVGVQWTRSGKHTHSEEYRAEARRIVESTDQKEYGGKTNEPLLFSVAPGRAEGLPFVPLKDGEIFLIMEGGVVYSLARSSKRKYLITCLM